MSYTKFYLCLLTNRKEMGQFPKLPDIDDNSGIISALNEGNVAVFDHVYRFYFRSLYAFCTQYVSASEAEEIVQDTMMWIWENKEQLIANLQLKSLLFTIVKNKALNKVSHHKVRGKVHQEIIDKYENEFSSPDFYLHSELFSIYKNALNNLPEEFRQAFEMNRNEELTHKEIAEKLNVSPQTVNYRIGKALKALRIELKDYILLAFFFLHYH